MTVSFTLIEFIFTKICYLKILILFLYLPLICIFIYTFIKRIDHYLSSLLLFSSIAPDSLTHYVGIRSHVRLIRLYPCYVAATSILIPRFLTPSHPQRQHPTTPFLHSTDFVSRVVSFSNTNISSCRRSTADK